MKTKHLKQMKNFFISTLFVVFVTSCQLNGKSISTPYSIAYSSPESGNREIYLTNIDDQAKVKITDHVGADGYSAWSPNGKRLAFYAKYGGRKTWSIHTMNSDGTNRKRLTHTENMWDNSPTWSPDGKKIAFSREYKDSENNWQAEVWIMNSNGSELAQIKSLKGGGPYFTQDGKIVFHSEYENKKSEISIADIDGSNIIHLTNNEADEWHPEISPDGKHIAFMSNRDGNHEIYVMDIDGSNQKRLTNSNAAEWYPSWSPDGSTIMYSSDDKDEENIYVMNKDGSSKKKIINNGSQASWLKILN